MNQGNCKWRVPLDGGSPPEWGVSLWGDTRQVFVTIIDIMTAIVNIVIMTVIVNIVIMKIKAIVEF